MIRALLPAPVVLPLLGVAVCLLAHRRLRIQRVVSIASVGGCLVAAIVLLAVVWRDGTAVTAVGGWAPPVGIALVADLFSALLLTVSTATVLCVLVFALGQLGRVAEARFFHPLYLVLTAGVAASFLTGDLFNLFVAFEMMLISSYALLTMAGRPAQVRPAMTYVVVSVLSSTLFITGVALLYATTGTVNMADLAIRLADAPAGLRTALGLIFLVVFGIKAAIFPLFFWLPDAYPTAPASVTAVFAGLLTKIGVYAIVRTQTLLFSGADGPDRLLLFLAGATMLVGVLGAIAQDDIKRILSFHIVSQIGYMIMGLGLFTVAGLAGATFYIVHHIPVKTALFLTGGIVERVTDTGALKGLGGLSRRLPVTALLFALPALSLAGMPPFSGFFSKLAIVQAGLDAQRYAVVGVSLVASLLTMFSMAKIWSGVFWGEPDEGPLHDAIVERGEVRLSAPRLMTGATAAMVAVSLVVALTAAPLYEMTTRAAESLLDRDAYIEAVLGGGAS